MPLNLETNMTSEFSIIRLLDNQLTSSRCLLNVDLAVSVDATKSNLAKDRLKAIKLWIDFHLNDAVAYNIATDVDTTMLESISNQIIMCPEDPHDYLLLVLIHAKLQAIGAGDIIINQTKLTADTGEGFSNSITGSTEEWLPTMTDWVGPRHFHKTPWWNRDDSSTMDMHPNDDDDLSVIPQLGVDLMTLINAEHTNATQESSTVAEIIKPTFKPRILTLDD